MKVRLLVATVLAGALAVSLSGAQAGGPPVMDGKKVKVLTMTAAGGVQQDEQNISFDETQCAAPKCALLPFVYKPAKGIKGGLMFTVGWTNPLSDLDVYVLEKQKDGSYATVGNCGAGTGNQEKVYLGPAELHVGKTYALEVYFWRSLSETANAKVEINVPSTMKNVAPSAVESVEAFNCTQ